MTSRRKRRRGLLEGRFQAPADLEGSLAESTYERGCRTTERRRGTARS